jgi:F-type H+-transporting ATPase subunit b
MLSARLSSNACSIGKRRDLLTRIHPTFPVSPSQARGRRTRLPRTLLALAAAACLVSGLGARMLAAPRQAEPAPPAASAEQASAGQPAAHAAEQPTPAAHAGGQPAADAHGEPAEGHGEGESAESPWAWVARLFNFAILAGGLFYLLRSPLAGFLEQRGVTVRSELTTAAELKKEAGAQVEQIEAKMAALPRDIEGLKRRGAEEIAAEEARIRALAETERRRLLDRAAREIDTRVRVAERDLKKRVGELAVGLATERVKRTITARDQARLVDRYVSQVRH